MGATKQDQDYAKSKETNSYNDGKGVDQGPRKVAGFTGGAQNPTKGGGINRPKNKSSLQ